MRRLESAAEPIGLRIGARRAANCEVGNSNWQMRTRRDVGTWKPPREEPEAKARARLATSRDFPTFGSPPTKRIPEAGKSPGSMSAGVGLGLCSSNCPNDRTPEADEPFFKVGFTVKPPGWRPARSVHRSLMLCARPLGARPSAQVCSLCAGRLWWLDRAPGAPCRQTTADARRRF